MHNLTRLNLKDTHTHMKNKNAEYFKLEVTWVYQLDKVDEKKTKKILTKKIWSKENQAKPLLLFIVICACVCFFCVFKIPMLFGLCIFHALLYIYILFTCVWLFFFVPQSILACAWKADMKKKLFICKWHKLFHLLLFFRWKSSRMTMPISQPWIPFKHNEILFAHILLCAIAPQRRNNQNKPNTQSINWFKYDWIKCIKIYNFSLRNI